MPEETEVIDQETETEPNDLKILRKKAKQHDEAVARAEKAERKLAVSEAGLKLSSRQLDALVATHSGDWEPEALKTTAQELGWYEPPEEETNTDEAEAHQRMDAAAAGGTTVPAVDWDAELKKAKTEEEFMETYRRSGRPLKT